MYRTPPKEYILEDLGSGDITSDLLLKNESAIAGIVVKENCVVAGLEEAKEIFEYLNLKVFTSFSDGQKVEKDTEVMRVIGSAKSILIGERVALNFLGRMSGIATVTHNLVERCKKINPNVKISATRKTTPGFRYYEKKAVIIGGGTPHRYGLYDGILIKDNHLKILGSVRNALSLALKNRKSDMEIEIEVENVEDAIEAAKVGADIIMLDNMKLDDVKKVVPTLKNINKNVKIEISGGITPKNILGYAKYADTISLGMLTHSTKSINFSLEITEVIS